MKIILKEQNKHMVYSILKGLAAKEYPEYAAFFLNAKTAIEPHLEKIKEQAAMCDKYEKIIAEKDLQIENLKKQLEK